MQQIEYKLQTVWSIKKETFMNKEEIESEHFATSLPDIKYSFVLRPGDGKYSAIWFHDHLEWELEDEITVKEMKLVIRSANIVVDLSTPINDPQDQYDKNGAFIKRQDFLNPAKKFFVDDILTMEIRGTLLYRDTSSFSLGRHLYYKKDKDFSFIVGTDEIKAHKFIVDQFSPVFAKILDSKELKIENFDSDVVKVAVGLCYGAWFDSFNFLRTNAQENLIKLIEFTNVYEMETVKLWVERKLIRSMNEKNVCELATKSLELKADTLKAFCINFIATSIKTGKPFDGFSDLKPEIVCEVFKNSVCHSQLC